MGASDMKLIFTILFLLLLSSCGGDSPATPDTQQTNTPNMEWDKTAWDEGDWG
jgi:hypothetical protein